VSLLLVPFLLVVGFFTLSTVVVVDSGAGPGPGPAPRVGFALVGLLVALLVFVLFVLALVVFVVTPIVGFFVALYYLYRRHEAVGVP